MVAMYTSAEDEYSNTNDKRVKQVSKVLNLFLILSDECT
jgi:hypothetical protein